MCIVVRMDIHFGNQIVRSMCRAGRVMEEWNKKRKSTSDEGSISEGELLRHQHAAAVALLFFVEAVSLSFRSAALAAAVARSSVSSCFLDLVEVDLSGEVGGG